MPIVNALLVRYAGGYHEVVDQDSIDEHGRAEGFLQLGGVQSEEDVETIASSLFAQMANPQVGTIMAIDPTGVGDVPNRHYRKGDYIIAPDENGVPTLQRVRSLTTTVDRETGKLLFVPELRDIVEEETDRLNRWLKRLANGALGGSTNTPSPATGGSGTPQLEAITFGELPPFSFPGPISTDTSGHYRPITATRIVRWQCSLRVAGTTATTIALIVNGSTVDTMTIGGGGTGVADFDSAPYEADVSTGTIVQVAVTTAGTSAEDLLVQVITGT